MLELQNEIDHLFQGVEAKVQLAFSFSSGEYENYRCLYSNLNEMKQGEIHSLYDMPQLLRLLCNTRKLWSSELKSELYQGLHTLTVILEWNDHSRKIAFLQTAQEEYPKLASLVTQKRELLQRVFQKAYYQEMN